MATYYVNSDLDSDTGTGTSGDPFGRLTFCLTSISAPAAGEYHDIKGKGTETLAASLGWSGGTINQNNPITFDCWDGNWTISGNNGNFAIVNGTTAFQFINRTAHTLRLTNTGTAVVMRLGQYGACSRCEVDTSTGGGILVTSQYPLAIYGNNVHNIAGVGISAGAIRANIFGNYLKNGASNKFTSAILSYLDSAVSRNIVSIDSTSNGIDSGLMYGGVIANNSIFSNGGSGKGVTLVSGKILISVINNLIEGFSSGSGGGIFATSSNAWAGMIGHNGVFNCVTAYQNTDQCVYEVGDDETLGASPFVKGTGGASDTFAERFLYFAPVDTGNVRGGALQ